MVWSAKPCRTWKIRPGQVCDQDQFRGSQVTSWHSGHGSTPPAQAHGFASHAGVDGTELSSRCLAGRTNFVPQVGNKEALVYVSIVVTRHIPERSLATARPGSTRRASLAIAGAICRSGARDSPVIRCEKLSI